MTRVPRPLAALWLVAVLPVGTLLAQTDDPPAPPPVFRSGVELVSVSAVVTDRRGRLVPDLDPEDFEVLDGGVVRPLIDFWADETQAVSLAVLLDASGSMGVGSKMRDARGAAGLLLARLRPGVDEHAVFSFDTGLREVSTFSTAPAALDPLVDGLKPYGATSLYDAIAETAHRLAERPTSHKAVVVFSDGLDTRSDLTAPEVSAIASSIDVPIYVVAVVSRLDLPDAPTAPNGAERVAPLRNLARWTGGGVYFASRPAEASLVTDELLNELRHRYVLAFESWSEAGWRLIEVRVEGMRVRTRSAYLAVP